MKINLEDKKDVAGAMGKALKKRGNYSIYKIEGKNSNQKETRIKHNLSHSEMNHSLRNDPSYKGGKGFGFGGRRTYSSKKHGTEYSKSGLPMSEAMTKALHAKK